MKLTSPFWASNQYFTGPTRNISIDVLILYVVQGRGSAVKVEGRSRTRYPVRLEVRYRSLDSGVELSGAGSTFEISSHSLAVKCSHGLTPGARVEVVVEWPCRLDSTVPLQLVVTGQVIRADQSFFAVKFAQYRFRTARTKPLPKIQAIRASA